MKIKLDTVVREPTPFVRKKPLPDDPSLSVKVGDGSLGFVEWVKKSIAKYANW